MASKDTEDSLLDVASQSSSDLEIRLSTNLTDKQKDNLILEHIKKMSSQEKTVLDPNESAEWACGLESTSLHEYCSGRIALLDFFTYCCINCQQVLPDIKDLENIYSPQDGFVVVGVHSAKFDTERESESVKRAAKRMNITHPVLNDPKAALWNRLGIYCWPTLVLLNPDGKPILVVAGEGHRDILFRCVSVALTHFRESPKSLKPFTGESTKPPKSIKDANNLSYPGKVCLNTFTSKDPGAPYLTISDSSNNRIVIADSHNQIIYTIGGTDAGFKDGSFKTARFDNPQGICWIDAETLVVCDTGNHAIRKVNFTTSTVELLAGTGVQSEFGDQGGTKYCQQSLSSPWDVVLYQTPDMDMSLRSPLLKKDDKTEKDTTVKETSKSVNDDIRRVLLIAVAGCHQIWALFLDTVVWWRYRTFTKGTLIPIVGSGREENRNNRFPNAAGFAQPSGLSLKENFLFVADSESSSIRKLDLKNGQLVSLVGGDRNPCNLFAYGDVDGVGYTARLQHPLGVAACPKTPSVYVADTYNHKIKKIDTTSNECSAFFPTLGINTRVYLSEPGGLCITPDGKTLYVADTNSYRIASINVQTKEAKSVKLIFPENKKKSLEDDYKDKDLIVLPSPLSVCTLKGSKIVLDLTCEVKKSDKNLHLTPQAPQRWNAKFVTAKDKTTDLISEWDVAGCVRSGKELPVHFEATLKTVHPEEERILRFEFMLSMCEGGLCFMRRFATDIVLAFKPNASSESTKSLRLIVNADRSIYLNVC